MRHVIAQQRMGDCKTSKWKSWDERWSYFCGCRGRLKTLSELGQASRGSWLPGCKGFDLEGATQNINVTARIAYIFIRIWFKSWAESIGIESVAKRESFQRWKQSEGWCWICAISINWWGPWDSGTDDCLQIGIPSTDSADQNVTSGILSV